MKEKRGENSKTQKIPPPPHQWWLAWGEKRILLPATDTFDWILIQGFPNRESGAGILWSFATAHWIGPRWISEWIFLLRIFPAITLSSEDPCHHHHQQRHHHHHYHHHHHRRHHLNAFSLLNSMGNQSRRSSIQLNHFSIHFWMDQCWLRLSLRFLGHPFFAPPLRPSSLSPTNHESLLNLNANCQIFAILLQSFAIVLQLENALPVLFFCFFFLFLVLFLNGSLLDFIWKFVATTTAVSFKAYSPLYEMYDASFHRILLAFSRDSQGFHAMILP